jgi:hypothetical protein
LAGIVHSRKISQKDGLNKDGSSYQKQRFPPNFKGEMEFKRFFIRFVKISRATIIVSNFFLKLPIFFVKN